MHPSQSTVFGYPVTSVYPCRRKDGTKISISSICGSSKRSGSSRISRLATISRSSGESFPPSATTCVFLSSFPGTAGGEPAGSRGAGGGGAASRGGGPGPRRLRARRGGSPGLRRSGARTRHFAGDPWRPNRRGGEFPGHLPGREDVEGHRGRRRQGNGSPTYREDEDAATLREETPRFHPREKVLPEIGGNRPFRSRDGHPQGPHPLFGRPALRATSEVFLHTPGLLRGGLPVDVRADDLLDFPAFHRCHPVPFVTPVLAGMVSFQNAGALREERLPRPENPALHRLNRNVQHGSHFIVRKPLTAVQEEGGPMPLRKIPERLDEFPLELLAPCDALGIPFLRARKREAFRRVPSLPVVVDRHFFPILLFVPPKIERRPPGDGVHPGGDSRRPLR